MIFFTFYSLAIFATDLFSAVINKSNIMLLPALGFLLIILLAVFSNGQKAIIFIVSCLLGAMLAYGVVGQLALTTPLYDYIAVIAQAACGFFVITAMLGAEEISAGLE